MSDVKDRITINFDIPIIPNKEYIDRIKDVLNDFSIVDDTGEKVLEMGGGVWSYRELYIIAHFLEEMNEEYEKHLEGINV